MQQLGLEPAPTWNVSITASGFACCATALAPAFFIQLINEIHPCYYVVLFIFTTQSIPFREYTMVHLPLLQCARLFSVFCNYQQCWDEPFCVWFFVHMPESPRRCKPGRRAAESEGVCIISLICPTDREYVPIPTASGRGEFPGFTSLPTLGMVSWLSLQ